MNLLESFLRSRGNLKEMERELASATRPCAAGSTRSSECSDSATGRRASPRRDFGNREGFEAGPCRGGRSGGERREILERLAHKEIGAEEAAEALRALGPAAR